MSQMTQSRDHWYIIGLWRRHSTVTSYYWAEQEHTCCIHPLWHSAHGLKESPHVQTALAYSCLHKGYTQTVCTCLAFSEVTLNICWKWGHDLISTSLAHYIYPKGYICIVHSLDPWLGFETDLDFTFAVFCHSILSWIYLWKSGNQKWFLGMGREARIQ